MDFLALLIVLPDQLRVTKFSARSVDLRNTGSGGGTTPITVPVTGQIYPRSVNIQ